MLARDAMCLRYYKQSLFEQQINCSKAHTIKRIEGESQL
ncbi:hypothetical protein M595_1359 [Lyngbya aestuarii BL J]|uniref:Uncharacterized protein n=1 Tax=Lyngbya aestuarii BL J TaxID=1348334 RepID=U7QKV3_9CYAN|nr:hypothetical protein M595_1359 [Lyngbya aestuarii BL J]